MIGLDDNANYHNGRTHAEHCAWLDSLVGDDFRIVHTPTGHLFNLAVVSFWKRRLLAVETSAGDRLKYLNGIAECVFGPISEDAVATIEPICSKGEQIFFEIMSLPVEKQAQAFAGGDVFRILARLNPSLLVSLRSCNLGPIPEQPRHSSPNLS